MLWNTGEELAFHQSQRNKLPLKTTVHFRKSFYFQSQIAYWFSLQYSHSYHNRLVHFLAGSGSFLHFTSIWIKLEINFLSNVKFKGPIQKKNLKSHGFLLPSFSLDTFYLSFKKLACISEAGYVWILYDDLLEYRQFFSWTLCILVSLLNLAFAQWKTLRSSIILTLCLCLSSSLSLFLSLSCVFVYVYTHVYTETNLSRRSSGSI